MNIRYVIAAFSILSTHLHAQPEELTFYHRGEFAEQWEVSAVGNVTWSYVPEGIQFTIHAVHENEEQLWPRLVLKGNPTDVTDFTRLMVELENPEERQNSITIGALSAREEVVGLASQIPGKSTGKVLLDTTGDTETLEVSSLNEIHIYQYKPIEDFTFILRKVAAIRNPDYISKRASLQAQLDEITRDLQSVAASVASEERFQKPLEQIRSRMSAAAKEFEEREPGYARRLDELNRETRSAIARVAVQTRSSKLTVWTTPLGVSIREGMLPMPEVPALGAIRERICLNQYKATPLNLSTSEEPATVKVRLATEHPKGIGLRQALWVKARDQSRTADALSSPTGEITLEMAPFSTEQILLWVDAKHASLTPGVLKGTVELTFGDQQQQSIPFEIEIVNVRLPDKAPLHLSNWAYFFIGSVASSRGLEPAILDNLRDYGMTAWNLDYIQVPLPEVDASGKYVGLKPDSVPPFRKVLDFLKGHPEEEIVVWLGFQRDELVTVLEKEGVFEGYLGDISAILDEFKIPKDKRLLMFWDEPKLPEIRQTVEWMKRVRKSYPEFKLYDNGSAVPSDDRELAEYTRETDIWFPNWEQLFIGRPEAVGRALAHRTKRMGFYRCLMSRNNLGVNIYEYYRLMSWYAMQHRFDTIVFWVHNVGSEDPWDGTTGSSSGGMVIYPKGDELFLSRRWEMFRETIDDYRLAGVAFGETGVLDAEKHPELKALVQQVTSQPGSPAVADQVREKLIDLALKRTP